MLRQHPARFAYRVSGFRRLRVGNNRVAVKQLTTVRRDAVDPSTLLVVELFRERKKIQGAVSDTSCNAFIIENESLF